MRLLSLLVSGLLVSGSFAGTEKLVNLDAENLHPNIQISDTEIAGHGGDAVLVQIGGDGWADITFNAVDEPWDLRGYFKVKADLTNLGSATAYLGLRLGSKDKPESETPQFAQGFDLFSPGQTRTVSIRLTSEEWIFEEPLELVGMRRAPGIELLDVSKIDSIQIFGGHSAGPIGPLLVSISNIRAEGEVTKKSNKDFLPFIDRYGQFKHGDWPGKIHSDADFAERDKAELEDLALHPGVPEFNQYGGWKDGPKLTASGYFRVEKVDGKWWFVDPEGCLFWSIGPDCITPDFGCVGVEFRENYFEELPAEGDPLSEFYIDGTWAPHGFYADKMPFKAFQAYKANLYRKYGEEWESRFNDRVHARLKSWGMNTVANWAKANVYLQRKTPYTAGFFVEGNCKLEGSKGYWGQFHDVFDPSFRETIVKNLKEREQEANDPWCIGFFVDNEVAWGSDGMSVAVETLASPNGQPAKLVFVEDLKKKYGDIGTLNTVWGTSHKSWNALLDSTEPPTAARAGDDLKAFYRKSADTYFKTIREELKKAAPNHLYLGCRFAWVNDSVALVAAEYCDVMSYNQYVSGVRHMRLPYFIDKPVVIGEYHFGSTERGHFHPGLQEGDTQEQRAERFKTFVKSGLDNPQIVGVHWFQYVDQHIAGRTDGENYNVGLVDICDTPYPEMVSAMREIGAAMYGLRAGKGE